MHVGGTLSWYKVYKLHCCAAHPHCNLDLRHHAHTSAAPLYMWRKKHIFCVIDLSLLPNLLLFLFPCICLLCVYLVRACVCVCVCVTVCFCVPVRVDLLVFVLVQEEMQLKVSYLSVENNPDAEPLFWLETVSLYKGAYSKPP